MRVIAYTDGSCNVKNKLGGFGVYIRLEREELFFKKGLENTTTGRAELHGAITCLQKIQDKDVEVDLYCDSEYVVKCVTDRRLWKWKRNCWMGIKNPDLIMKLYEEVIKFKKIPKFHHIKGHTKETDEHSTGNQIVDILADYKNHEIYEIDQIT